MSRRLDPAIAERLAKLLGRFGSDFDGERATAARMADQLVRSSGLSWADVLGVADADDTPPTGHRELAAWLLRRLPDLSERDRQFLETMSGWWREPSPKQQQRAWLDGLARRVT